MIANNDRVFEPGNASRPEMPKLQIGAVPLSGLRTERRGRSEASALPFYWSGGVGSAAWLLNRLDPWPVEGRGVIMGVTPGGIPPNVPAWAGVNLPPGWSVASVWDTRAEAPQVWWKHEDGRRVCMISAGIWFGPGGDYDAADCHRAEALVRVALGVGWHGYAPGPVLSPTPASTGRVLFQTHASGTYPVLDPEAQAFIRATSGQGRTEFLPDVLADYEAVPEVYEIDCRLAYLSLCANLPTGDPVVIDHLPTGDWIHRNWRALVDFEAPAGWAHLGLLPCRRPDGRWDYPHKGRAWIDRSEWYLARKWGWSLSCDQAIVWPGSGDPLGKWAERLVVACDWLDDNRPSPLHYRMVRHALRHVGLDALGAFHGTPRRTTYTATAAHEVPDEATDVRFEGDVIAYEAPAPIGWAASMAHPEWSAAVWARCRARIMDGGVHKATGMHEGEGALFMDPDYIMAIQTDSLITSAPPPWPEGGRAGSLRVKDHTIGPFDFRTSHDVLAALGKGARR